MAKKYGKRYTDPREALAARTERNENGCLIWTGALTEKGYGVIYYEGRTQRAHRVAWQLEHGPIAPGIVIDHASCYEHACVDVSHLREATKAQNQANRAGAKSATGHRNVYHHSGGYLVVVEKSKIRHGSWHKKLAPALAEAALLRGELFGDFAGRG